MKSFRKSFNWPLWWGLNKRMTAQKVERKNEHNKYTYNLKDDLLHVASYVYIETNT